MGLKRLTEFIIDVVGTATSKQLLTQHLRTPLYRNAYYLMLGAVAFNILGFVFWIVAARLFSPKDIGLASAVISAVVLLASLSNLGLGYGLIRFLPSARERSMPMINSCLTLAGLVSLIASGIFLAGLSVWSPALSFLREHPVYIATFLVFTVMWVLSSIVDETFIAKRAAQFAVIKSVIAGGFKIPLLYLPVTLLGAFTIFSSAALATLIALLIAVLWLMPLMVRGYLPMPALRREAINEVIHYSLGNYAALLLWGIPAAIYPLMVVNILGAEANAYFYIAWAIASVIFMIPVALSFSLFAEGSHSEELLLPNTAKSIRLGILILVPAILIVCTLGDKLLLFFGKAYSQNAAVLLSVLAFSVLPMTVNHLYLSVNRVRKNLRVVVAVSATVAFLSLYLGYLFMLRLGIIGVGIGFTAGQSLVAAAVIWPLLRRPLRA